MADNFSLDDILAEVDRKRASRAEQSGPESAQAVKKTIPSVTDVLREEELHARLQESRAQTEVQKNSQPAAESKPRRSEHAKAPEKYKGLFFQKPEKKAQKADLGVTQILSETSVKAEKAESAEAAEKPVIEAKNAGVKNTDSGEKGKGLFFQKPEKKAQKADLGVTQILSETPVKAEKVESAEAAEKPVIEAKNAGVKNTDSGEKGKGLFFQKPEKKAQKADLGVTQILSETPVKAEKAESAEAAEKPVIEAKNAGVKNADSGEKGKGLFFQKPEKKAQKADLGVTQILSETPVKAEKAESAEAAESRTEPVTAELPANELSAKEAALTTKSIELEEAEVAQPQKKKTEKPTAAPAHKKSADSEKQAEKRRQQKQERFEMELELDESDDLIDAINPMELEIRSANDFNDFMSGDTIGLAGNDLKKMAGVTDIDTAKTDRVYLNVSAPAKTKEGSPTQEHTLVVGAEKPKAEPLDEEVKDYTPKGTQEQKKSPSPELKRRSNTAFLEKLNKSLAERRQSEQQAQKTLGFEPEEAGASIDRIKAPEQGLNVDYSKKIIQATGAIPTSDSQLIEKLAAEKKKRSIRDFVMDEEDDEDYEEEETNGGIEFDSYDTTGQIWADLCESHKGLKTRFALLLILTAAILLVTLFNDFGQGLSFNLFGLEIDFMNKRQNPQGFIFFNLIASVLGMAACSTLLINGISKLFRGKADCDSVCAVTNVIALIMPILHLTNFDYLQRSKAYIYTLVALGGLLFNTAGKLLMIVRAKQNFRFVSGDSVKYSTVLVDESVAASHFTKGVVREIPYLAAMRKTEFLTDFLRNSYCEDKADRISRLITPAGLIASMVAAVAAYFIPNGAEGMENNIFWASTVMVAVLGILAPLSIMFVVNIPLSRACKALAKSDSVVLGYKAAEQYADTNAVMVDASLLFPAGSSFYTKIKHCKQKNSINNISVEQALILAGSLAVKSGSVLSEMFRDMVADKDELLVKIENCIYEDNMGVLGWYGNKRLIMGNREHMLHHDIRIPEISQVNKQLGGSKKQINGEVLYLAVAGELVLIMLVDLIPNNGIRDSLQKLVRRDVRIVVKTTDSIVTVAKIAEVFDIDPEYVKVLPASAHEQFAENTRYVSRGDGAVSCNGTFSSFANAILAAKRLVSDISLGMGIMLAGAVLGALCAILLGVFAKTELLSPSALFIWNLAWFVLGTGAQYLRKY